MSKHIREKIALVVFALLVALAGCCLGGYLVAGHSWNVAASSLDDTFGSMEGYTVIVYGGVVVAADDATETLADDDSGKFPATAKAAEAAKAAKTAAIEGNEHPVTADQVCVSYEEKNATVFALDIADLDRYAEGTILKKGACRFGVFSVGESTRPLQVRQMVDYFEEHEVDFVVAIAADKRLVDNVADGIDIVVSIRDEDLFVMGEMVDGTFFVDSPETGSVGVILISPSNVVSAKVIDEL